MVQQRREPGLGRGGKTSSQSIPLVPGTMITLTGTQNSAHWQQQSLGMSQGVCPGRKVMPEDSQVGYPTLQPSQFWAALSPASSLLAPRESSSIN